jgi:hypothetical protein
LSATANEGETVAKGNRSLKKSVVAGARKQAKRSIATVGKKPARRQTPAGTVDRRRIATVLRRLEQAQAGMAARGTDLLAVAHDIGRSATEAHKQRLRRSLVETQLLRDLQAAQRSFSDVAGNAPPDLAEFRLLPEALMNWFSEQLNLTPFMNTGDTIEVPASKLEDFDFSGDLPGDTNALVRVRVKLPGLRNGKTVILPPKLEPYSGP